MQTGIYPSCFGHPWVTYRCHDGIACGHFTIIKAFETVYSGATPPIKLISCMYFTPA